MEGVEHPVQHRQLGTPPHPFDIEDRLGLLPLVGQEDDHADARLPEGHPDLVAWTEVMMPVARVEGRAGDLEAGAAESRVHDNLLEVERESDATPEILS